MIAQITHHPELLVLCFGLLSVFASLEHIPDARKRGWLFIAVFVGQTVTQLCAHGFQYAIAVGNREKTQKEIDAQTAIALFAYSRDNVDLLKKTTNDAYLIGYRYFEDHHQKDAEQFFKEALNQRRYVAASDYLLAYMDTHDSNGKLNNQDYSHAIDLLHGSIEDYPDYAQAFYLLAQLNANSRHITEALDDLRQAVMYKEFSLVPCLELNDKKTETDWGDLSKKTEFFSIQRECKEIHGLS